jgi:hypothetical protein
MDTGSREAFRMASEAGVGRFDLKAAVLGNTTVGPKEQALRDAITALLSNLDHLPTVEAMEVFADIFNSSVGAAIDSGKEYDDFAKTYLRVRWAMVGAYASAFTQANGDLLLEGDTLYRAMDRVVREARCAVAGCGDPRNGGGRQEEDDRSGDGNGAGGDGPLRMLWVFCQDYEIGKRLQR